MTGFLKDLRFATRIITKQPGLSAIAITALAMGIGFTSIMFSIVHGALLRGLPFEGGERIMHLSATHPSGDFDNMPVSIHDYLDWREQQTSYEHLSGFYEGTVNFRGSEGPLRYDGAFVTANTFASLGAQPILGRTFNEDEDEPGAPMTAVLSHHVWQDSFDGSTDVLGQIVTLNGEQAEVIGVMPEGFLFPTRQDIWVPLRMNPLELERGEGMGLQVFGTLRAGVSVDQAMVEFTGISARLATAYPESNEGVTTVMRRFTHNYIGEEAIPMLWTMLAIVGLVLLIACANVANLLLARAALRVKELGIRTAMGAHRLRIVSQMVAEALVLATLGGIVGVGIAAIGIDLFAAAIATTDLPYWTVFQLDGPILLFIMALCAVSAVVSGAIPAIKATGADVTTILKDESRGSSSMSIGRLSKYLVIGELAMSLGLLVAAGLMTKSITTLRNLDYGFDREEVFSARVGLFETEFPTVESRLQFFEAVQERVESIPGVTSATLAMNMPGQGTGISPMAIEGQAYADDRDYPMAHTTLIAPRYFETFGAEILQGRGFTELDNADGIPVAIVNESFARLHLPNGALDSRIRIGREDTGQWLTVVGLVPDLFMDGVGNTGGFPQGIYTPLAQSDARFMTIAAAGPAEPMSLTSAVRDAVTAVNANTPIYFVDTLAGRLEENTWFYNVFGTLFVVFGVAALFMAAVGLYGVMSFAVSRRITEMGIRMALGAEGGQVLRLVLRQGVGQIAIGLGLGLALAFLLSRSLQLVLFQVNANDPTVFLVISLVLGATGLLASTIPARRATRVDPMVALRQD